MAAVDPGVGETLTGAAVGLGVGLVVGLGVGLGFGAVVGLGDGPGVGVDSATAAVVIPGVADAFAILIVDTGSDAAAVVSDPAGVPVSGTADVGPASADVIPAPDVCPRSGGKAICAAPITAVKMKIRINPARMPR